MNSILTSVKKLLGIAEECEDFDADIVMYLNSVFMVLTQMGVGPKEGFAHYWKRGALEPVYCRPGEGGSRESICRHEGAADGL